MKKIIFLLTISCLVLVGFQQQVNADPGSNVGTESAQVIDKDRK